MTKWREREWRIPRRGDIVRDHDGNLGLVISSTGTLTKRTISVTDVNGTETHTNEEAEAFFVINLDESKKFHIQRLEHKGLHIGALCSFNGNYDVPLEIIDIEWSALRGTPMFWLKDLREFNDNILKTPKERLIRAFSLNMPPVETIFSIHESNLKWRLDIGLVEKNREGWAGSGSPWEFSTKEKAYKEVGSWKSRLKIRRYASVINANWEIEFPCWTVVSNGEDFKLEQVAHFIGSPAYFSTALHAATCYKAIPNDWKEALTASQDPLF